MHCASCGFNNRDGAKFCNECGSPLVLRCASCGTENPGGANSIAARATVEGGTIHNEPFEVRPDMVADAIQELFATRLRLAELANVPAGHLRVAEQRAARKTTELHFFVFDRRHLDLNIAAVEQRAGDFRPVPLDLLRRAGAFVLRVGGESA